MRIKYFDLGLQAHFWRFFSCHILELTEILLFQQKLKSPTRGSILMEFSDKLFLCHQAWLVGNGIGIGNIGSLDQDYFMQLVLQAVFMATNPWLIYP